MRAKPQIEFIDTHPFVAGELLYQLQSECGEIVRVRRAFRRLAIFRIDEQDIQIGTEVELPAAKLAEADNGERHGVTLGIKRDAVLVANLCFHLRVECLRDCFSQVRQFGCCRRQRGVAEDIPQGDAPDFVVLIPPQEG